MLKAPYRTTYIEVLSATKVILNVNFQIKNNFKIPKQPNIFAKYLYSEQETIFFIMQKKSWTLISPGIRIFQSQFQQYV